jgi:hypothetical protein
MKPVFYALVPSRYTARRAMAVRLFATEPRIYEAHLSAVVPVVTCKTQSSPPVSAATNALRHAPSSIYPHKVGSTPRWTGPNHTHRQKTVIGGTTIANAKTFLRSLDGTHRKMKEESDASFVLSLLYYLEPVHRKSTRVPLRTWQGRRRPGNPVLVSVPTGSSPQPPNVGALRVGVVLDGTTAASPRPRK